MGVLSALHPSLQRTLYVLAIVLALALLVIVLVFGAIFARAYRNHVRSFSYFAGGDDKPKVTDFSLLQSERRATVGQLSTAGTPNSQRESTPPRAPDPH